MHTRKIYICIIDQQGNVKIHKNIKTDPDTFLKLVAAFTDNLVVGVECIFCWYLLSDLYHEYNITFVYGALRVTFWFFPGELQLPRLRQFI